MSPHTHSQRNIACLHVCTELDVCVLGGGVCVHEMPEADLTYMPKEPEANLAWGLLYHVMGFPKCRDTISKWTDKMKPSALCNGAWTLWVLDTSGHGHSQPWPHQATDPAGLGHTKSWTQQALDESGHRRSRPWTHQFMDTMGLGHVRVWAQWALDTSGHGNRRLQTHQAMDTAGWPLPISRYNVTQFKIKDEL